MKNNSLMVGYHSHLPKAFIFKFKNNNGINGAIRCYHSEPSAGEIRDYNWKSMDEWKILGWSNFQEITLLKIIEIIKNDYHLELGNLLGEKLVDLLQTK